MDYKMEDLLPVVAELAEKYTSKESTSLPYEKARQLMEAVLYCIREGEEYALSGGVVLPAREAYWQGYQKVLQKLERTREKYAALMELFWGYENENYTDTVTEAISGFFRYYDPRFAPQNTIITMDYPTIRPIERGCEGIDAIERYVEYIALEQLFLQSFHREFCQEVLNRFDEGYKKQFYNVCTVVLRYVLGCMLIGKSLGARAQEEDYKKMKQAVRVSTEELESVLCHLLEQWMDSAFNNNEKLYWYLSGDIHEFAVYLELWAEHNFP